MIRAAIIGATGYTGAELLRLLHAHPQVEITRICGQSRAGEPLEQVLPSFAGLIGQHVAGFDADDVAMAADVAFCALPHGASAPAVSALRERRVIVFDLSADFRLSDRKVYEQWYGEHRAPDLFGSAVYGLVEWSRGALRTADLVAVPGCYPTAVVLALAPLLADRLVEPDGIIVDAKTGVSGAGRSPGAASHFPEVAEGVRAYKTAGAHRHTPEIEEQLSAACGQAITVTFSPHLIPMTRGILATCYARPAPGCDPEACTAAAKDRYANSPSVVALPPGTHPDTAWVRGSNRVHLAYDVDRRANLVIAQATIDNLVKGAAGQAVQAMNVRFGFPEGEALSLAGAWP